MSQLKCKSCGGPGGSYDFCSAICERDWYTLTTETKTAPQPKEHTMLCNETSTGWDVDADGNDIYDCHCGAGYFPGEQ